MSSKIILGRVVIFATISISTIGFGPCSYFTYSYPLYPLQLSPTSKAFNSYFDARVTYLFKVWLSHHIQYLFKLQSFHKSYTYGCNNPFSCNTRCLHTNRHSGPFKSKRYAWLADRIKTEMYSARGSDWLQTRLPIQLVISLTIESPASLSSKLGITNRQAKITSSQNE